VSHRHRDDEDDDGQLDEVTSPVQLGDRAEAALVCREPGFGARLT
jgi:hypothetical protein